MVAHHRKNDALDLLSRSERELVVKVLDQTGDQDRECGDEAFLALARIRLRNIVEKHAGALKRARIAARSGGSDKPVAVLELQHWICSEALAACSERLKHGGTEA